MSFLKDVIEIFESHGWEWSYHAFREWQGWSVELGTDREDLRRLAAPSERQQLLQGGGLEKNKTLISSGFYARCSGACY